MIKLCCKGNDIPTNLQSKAGCLACNPPFSSVLPKKSSSIHLRATVWKVKPKCFRNGTQCLKFGLGRRAFYFGLQPRLHVWESNRHSRSQQRHFVPIGSTRDTNKFHACFVFSKRFYRFLYLGDQMISRWRVWPSTSKSTCVVPAWPREDFFWGLCKPIIAVTDLLPQEMFTFAKWIANYGSLACVCLKSLSVPSRRACACVIGSLQDFMHTCLLSKTFHLNTWKTKIICSRKTNLWLKKFCPKTNKQTQNLTKVYWTPELHLRLQCTDVSFHCPLGRHLKAYEPLALSYPSSQLMRTVAG